MTGHTFGQGSSFAIDDAVVSDGEKARPHVDKSLGIAQKQRVITLKARPSPYAYVFYATQDTYACSVLVNIRQLQGIHKTPHRIFVLITKDISANYVSALSSTGAMLSLQIPPPLREGTEGGVYYRDCLLKLFGFKMHRIDPSLKKVIVLDSDQLILKPLDHLFYMDALNADLAAPRAYWIDKQTFSTAFMVISLSDRTWRKVETALQNVKIDQYDMDIANEVFGDEVLMLTGSFVALNSHWEDWNLPRWFHAPDVIVTEPVLPSISTKADDKSLATDHSHPSSGRLPDTIPGIINAPKDKKHDRPFTPDRDPTITEHTDLKSRYLYNQLFDLYNQVSVLHYTAMTKPWGTNAMMIDQGRPDAHPLLREQFMA
ncbi:nucleotide-diphospho-sugar transferase [Aureobasidium namibiae CBS 147.97]|uniref:Nucleotide-diphospho-sugar transferase n=1 Tax=Aureobasidium namibiae CBS 147.97 TaxID=1043004 RepID=A0A074W8H4_9PEZI